ncbi:MAG: N-acetyltransferase [Candidatus Limnocylindrales bacterium]
MTGRGSVRRARPDDARAIHALIHRYAGQALLLPRPIADIQGRIRDFWVITQGDEVLGCAALRIWWHDLAEVRSLAVGGEAGGHGYGGRLVEAVAAEAERYGVRVLFALTRIEPWFTAHGFTTVDRAVLYQKVWGDCAHCPFRQACDEVAVVRPLAPGALEPLLHPDPAALARVAHVVPPRAPGEPELLRFTRRPVRPDPPGPGAPGRP